ncbi:MAG TPA: hypothetical protein VI197_15525 [Polyangiaceae bacterium]
MSARPYLLSVLLFTGCYEDTDSEVTTGTATGTMTSAGGAQGTLSGATVGSGGSGGPTSGGSTTSTGAAAGGGAGEGQGGMAGGGAGGAGGAAGSGGEGGAPNECVPALHAVVRSIFGNFDCPELEACIVESCPNELAAAMGDGWERADHSGGICAGYADCVEACDCESECSLECRDEHANGGACLDAVIEVSLCRNEACPAADDDCAP